MILNIIITDSNNVAHQLTEPEEHVINLALSRLKNDLEDIKNNNKENRHSEKLYDDTVSIINILR